MQTYETAAALAEDLARFGLRPYYEYLLENVWTAHVTDGFMGLQVDLSVRPGMEQLSNLLIRPQHTADDSYTRTVKINRQQYSSARIERIAIDELRPMSNGVNLWMRAVCAEPLFGPFVYRDSNDIPMMFFGTLDLYGNPSIAGSIPLPAVSRHETPTARQDARRFASECVGELAKGHVGIDALRSIARHPLLHVQIPETEEVAA